MVDDAGFTKLMKEAYPHDDIPAKSTIKNNIKLYIFYMHGHVSAMPLEFQISVVPSRSRPEI